MQIQHDKHTYYFEKYLRNEMLGEEKVFFEEKLATDEKFKAQFNAYAFNHEEIMKQELEEYYNEEIIPDKPKKSYSWFLLSLSVLGIVLIADYYANQKYYEEQQKNQSYKQVLVDRIKGAIIYPFKFFIPKERNKSMNEVKQESNDDVIQAQTIDADSVESSIIDSTQIEQTIDGQLEDIVIDNRIANSTKDYLLNDSLMLVFELEKFKEKFKIILQSTDSAINDSLVNRLTLQSLSKQNIYSKPLYVEFWYSIIGFKGYQFNGKKLLLFGIEKPFDVFLLRQNNQIILHSSWGETALVADNELYKLED